MMRILIEVHEGQVVRNLLENQLLSLLVDQKAEVFVVTSAARVPSFVSRYFGEQAHFFDLDLLDGTNLTRWENYEFALGQKLSASGYHSLRRWIWSRITEPFVAHHSLHERAFLEEHKPDVVVSTHLSQTYGRGLVAIANQMRIPTIGNLNSWDNAWKGLKVRPKLITCWSANNKDELCNLASYHSDQVSIIGAPAFDAYFAAGAQWTRADLCVQLGLDPSRSILLFATLGQFKQQIDETNPLEALLKSIDAGEIPGNPQVVVRLHPWSRETYFKPLLQHPCVTVSRYEHYVPGLTWTPTREEAILAGNLMRHANVVISPGSTMVVEAAIFDTPVIVPVFNEYMPDVFDAYFKQTWLNQHFRHMVQNDWFPLVKSPVEMVSGVKGALIDPLWYCEGRAKIRENILGPLDGRATERFANAILGSC